MPAKLPAIPAGLDHNLGATGQAFNTEHPYFANTKLKTLQNVAQYASYNKEYRKEYFDVKTGGYVVVHKKADKKDKAKNVEVGKILAKNSYRVQVNKHEQNKGRQPEYIINNRLSDLKIPETKSDYKVFINAFEAARKQDLKECVIYLKNQKYKITELLEGLKQAFFNKKAMKRVVVVYRKKAKTITRDYLKSRKAEKILRKLFR